LFLLDTIRKGGKGKLKRKGGSGKESLRESRRANQGKGEQREDGRKGVGERAQRRTRSGKGVGNGGRGK